MAIQIKSMSANVIIIMSPFQTSPSKLDDCLSHCTKQTIFPTRLGSFGV